MSRTAVFKGQLALFRLDTYMKVKDLIEMPIKEDNWVVYYPAKRVVKLAKYIPQNNRAVIEINGERQQVKITTLSRIYFVSGFDYFNQIQKKIEHDITFLYVDSRGKSVNFRNDRAVRLEVEGSIFGSHWQSVKLL